MSFLDPSWLDLVLLTFMVITAIAVVIVRSVFASVMLMGIFSLLSATLFVVLDAVDVAFTEAAVGAGISVVVFLGALSLIPSPEPPRRTVPVFALLACLACGTLLIGGTLDMPHYGRPDAPIHTHVADVYLAEAEHETGVPNIVTAVLASYRGYDTLGETTVIFTAAIGVMALIGGAWRTRRKTTATDPPPTAASGPMAGRTAEPGRTAEGGVDA
ncbi:MAG: DUF4040 domain-containing protein [Alphaproteobacteria bacterium]|nr:DUF4040 domain-containing protein [Alphaproteobacteria bacterium]